MNWSDFFVFVVGSRKSAAGSRHDQLSILYVIYNIREQRNTRSIHTMKKQMMGINTYYCYPVWVAVGRDYFCSRALFKDKPLWMGRSPKET